MIRMRNFQRLAPIHRQPQLKPFFTNQHIYDTEYRHKHDWTKHTIRKYHFSFRNEIKNVKEWIAQQRKEKKSAKRYAKKTKSINEQEDYHAEDRGGHTNEFQKAPHEKQFKWGVFQAYAWIKYGTKFYGHSFKKFYSRFKKSTRIIYKVTFKEKREMSWREDFIVNSTLLSVFKLVPYAAIMVIPGSTLIIPILAAMFPWSLPVEFHSHHYTLSRFARIIEQEYFISRALIELVNHRFMRIPEADIKLLKELHQEYHYSENTPEKTPEFFEYRARLLNELTRIEKLEADFVARNSTTLADEQDPLIDDQIEQDLNEEKVVNIANMNAENVKVEAATVEAAQEDLKENIKENIKEKIEETKETLEKKGIIPKKLEDDIFPINSDAKKTEPNHINQFMIKLFFDFHESRNYFRWVFASMYLKRMMLKHQIRGMRQDDLAIEAFGIQNLTRSELMHILSARGVSLFSLTEAECPTHLMRDFLSTWIDFSKRTKSDLIFLMGGPVISYHNTHMKPRGILLREEVRQSIDSKAAAQLEEYDASTKTKVENDVSPSSNKIKTSMNHLKFIMAQSSSSVKKSVKDMKEKISASVNKRFPSSSTQSTQSTDSKQSSEISQTTETLQTTQTIQTTEKKDKSTVENNKEEQNATTKVEEVQKELEKTLAVRSSNDEQNANPALFINNGQDSNTTETNDDKSKEREDKLSTDPSSSKKED